MRQVLIIMAFLLGCSLTAIAQKNLVLNGAFEQHSFCPKADEADQINAATYWSAVDSLDRFGCIPEYCNSCAGPGKYCSVPLSILYWQYCHSGQGMAQVLMLYQDTQLYYQRDYLQGRLIRKLSAGKKYCVSFYVNLAENSKNAIKDISAYLDNGAIDTSVTSCVAQTKYSPQITNSGGFISDTTNWVKVEGTMTATGSEQFITIGNFKSTKQTPFIIVPSNKPDSVQMDGAYYLVDDVSVVETGTKADAGPDKHVVGYGDSVYIGLPSSEVLWNSWSVLGSTTVIGEGPGIWVKPKTTTNYVVTQTLCGTTTTDTVRVELWAAGITSIGGQSQQYTLTPNPVKDVVVINQFLKESQQVNAELYDASGRILYSTSLRFDGSISRLDVRSIPKGLYLLRLREDNGNGVALRFVKE